MKFFKNLLIATSLTLSGYFKPKEAPSPAQMEEQLEPEELRDEWQTMLHHDDVTPEERAWLESEDPADIKRARDAIFEREDEFQAWWDDKETRNAAFYGKHAKSIAAGVTVPDIETLEGWEDDEDMPEYYETVIQIPGTLDGKIVKVPYALGEKLMELLGPEDEYDEQFDFMLDYLSEVYTERGELMEEDYMVANHQWEQQL